MLKNPKFLQVVFDNGVFLQLIPDKTIGSHLIAGRDGERGGRREEKEKEGREWRAN